MATALDTYLPFDAGAGANVTEDQWRKMARLWAGSGPLRGEDNEFLVYDDNSGMQVKVKTGKCFIRGQYGENASEKTLAITANASGSTRIDRVVLRNDFVNNQIVLDVIAGTPGSGAAPAVTQSTSMWEISLATVSVPTGDTSISGQTTDTRQLISTPAVLAGDHTVNGLRAMVLLEAPTNDDLVEGVLFKARNSTYGQNAAYASGQPFVVLSDADTDASSTGSVGVAITGITNATPMVVTTGSAHGASTGDVLRFTGTGLTYLDSKWRKITRLSATTFSVDGSTAGGASATGYVAASLNPVMARTPMNGGAGFCNLLHVAVGLRGQSGQAINAAGGAGFGSFTAQPCEDLPGVLAYNPPTTAWTATPVSPYFRAYDIRTSPNRVVFDVEADGLVTIRSQVSKSSTGSVLRVRDAADAADIFKVRVDGGLFAGGPNHGIGSTGPTAAVLLLLQSLNVGDTTFFAAQKSGQTASILLVNDATFATTLWRVNKDGYMGIAKKTAPANGDVGTSELMFWLDDTIGATKAMFKAKDSAGTVRTGSVALT